MKFTVANPPAPGARRNMAQIFNELKSHPDILDTGYAVDATYTTSCAPLPMMEDLGLGSVAIAKPASL